jgi:drug/metabolite transporter (DMT)-like permease
MDIFTDETPFGIYIVRQKKPVTNLIYIVLGLAAVSGLVLWVYAFRDLSRTTVFTGGSKTAWFVIILIGPIAGSVAYLSAKRSVERYAKADPARFTRLLSKEK